MMSALISSIGNVWAGLFGVVWLLVGLIHLNSLRTGVIMGITAGPRAIKQSERPVRFWVSWFLLAWPFVFFPAIAFAGLMLEWSAK